MPQVTIYIRKPDLAKWQAIANKPDWLHEHINMPKFSKMQLSTTPVPIAPGSGTGFLVPIGKPKSVDRVRRNKPESLCPHFQTKGSCLVKGCK